MKRVIGVVQILVVIALVAVASLIACRPDAGEDDAEVPATFRGAPQGSQITVALIQPEMVGATVEIDATGTISYRTAVSIVPQVGGRVTWVSPNLRNGGEFQADEVVFKLDPIDAELNVQQAKADLAVALAEMNLTQAERNAASENYLLLNPGKDVPPLVAKEPQLERSKASIDRAKARLLAAELSLSRTQFSFPFTGRVLTSNVGVGQLVGSNQAVGQVYDISELEAVIPISNLDLEALVPVVGRSVLVEAQNGVVEATVERQSAQLDDRTRTASLYAKIDSGEHGLVPGNFIRARIFGQQVDRAYVLPEAAEQAQSTVWIVNGGVLQRQSIEIRDRREDGILVDAFEYYDGIVLGAMPNVEEGDAVQVANMSKT